MLTLFLNPDKTPAALQGKADGAPISSLNFKRGADIPLRVVVIGSQSATQLRIGVKAKNAFEEDLLVFGNSETGEQTVEGTVFDMVLSITSAALNDALDVGEGCPHSPHSIPAMTEFAWREGESPRISETVSTVIFNDIIRLATDAPEAVTVLQHSKMLYCRTKTQLRKFIIKETITIILAIQH